MPVGIERPFAPGSQRPVQRVHPAFPDSVKDRLVLLIFDGPHAMHSPHIVYAVHSLSPLAGGFTFATPIMASRVTSAANSSSVRLSVPAGRSGSTRYLNSAVLSQT